MHLKKSIFPTIFTSCIFLFLYIPIFVLCIFSFNSRNFPAPWDNFTLDWYRALFSHKELWTSFFHSCIVASVTTIICLVFSLSILFFLSRGGKIKKFIPLFYGNLIIPDIVFAVGLISYFYIMEIPLGLHAIIIAHSIIGLGFAVPILSAQYHNLGEDIFESSRTLGATYSQTFTKIIIPLMGPTLAAVSLIIFILSFDDFILSYFCASPSSQTLSVFLVASLRQGVSPVINALACILLLFIAILATIFFSLKRKTEIL